jgi:hypothetical protein
MASEERFKEMQNIFQAMAKAANVSMMCIFIDIKEKDLDERQAVNVKGKMVNGVGATLQVHGSSIRVMQEGSIPLRICTIQSMMNRMKDEQARLLKLWQDVEQDFEVTAITKND